MSVETLTYPPSYRKQTGSNRAAEAERLRVLLSARGIRVQRPHHGNFPGMRLVMASRTVRTIITMQVAQAMMLKKRELR